MMLASPVVRSAIFLILIFPLSFALSMDSISLSVVCPYGISVMASVLLSIFSIFALTRMTPPLCPLLYLVQSANPPVGKSG